MKEYLRKNGIRMAVLVLLVVIVIGVNSASANGNITFVHNVTGIVEAPVKKVLSSAVNWFDTIFGYFSDFEDLQEQNAMLRQELADAQAAARAGIEASEENTELRESMGLRMKSTQYDTESCKVVLWTSSNWSHSFTISKGAASGIELGDPVMTEYGVMVGTVTELGTTWATVSTIIDPDSSIGTFTGTVGIPGKVNGVYSLMRENRVQLAEMSEGAVVTVGDEVLTSGSGGAIPAGLVIGILESVHTNEFGQIEYGTVLPTCDFDSLVQVFVIKEFMSIE